MTSTKDMKQLIVEVEGTPGWSVKMSRSGHYRITGPNEVLLFVASTPSDSRSVLNARAELRKRGAKV